MGTVMLLGVVAALVGVVATRRPRAGVARRGALRPDRRGGGADPTGGAAVVGAALPPRGPRRDGGAVAARRPSPSVPRPRRQPGIDGAPERPAPGADRRAFLLAGAGVVALTLVSGGAGVALERGRSVSGERAALRLPAPASGAAALPAGVELGRARPRAVPHLEPGLLPGRHRARSCPRSARPTGGCAVDGLVDRPLELSYDDLLVRGASSSAT